MSTIAVAFGVYTLAIIAVGLAASRKTYADGEDYFLGGRTLGPWLSALSSGASGSSAWVTMGLVGLGFSTGVRAYWLLPGVLLGIAFNWFVLAKPMRRRAAELGAVTIPDLLAMHFRERLPLLRLLSVLVILAAMFLYVAAQLAAAGTAFGETFDWKYQTGVVIGAGIILAYTVAGGFRATCWTDSVQAVLMLVALAGIPFVILAKAGGLSHVIDGVHAADPALMSFIPDATGVAFIGFLVGSSALGVNFGYPGQPHVLVRLMALRDDRAVGPGAAIHILWVVLIYAGAVTTGLFVRGAAGGGAAWAASTDNSELALIVAAMELLPGLLSGLVLAAVLSAMASTADSQLVVAASAVSSDAFARLRPSTRARTLRWLNRLTVLALGIGAVLLVIDQEVKVYEYVIVYGWAMLGAAFGPQVALMLLWKRATYAGCLCGMLTGFATVIVWKLAIDQGWIGPPWSGFYNLTVGFVAALVVNVLVSLATPKPADAPR